MFLYSLSKILHLTRVPGPRPEVTTSYSHHLPSKIQHKAPDTQHSRAPRLRIRREVEIPKFSFTIRIRKNRQKRSIVNIAHSNTRQSPARNTSRVLHDIETTPVTYVGAGEGVGCFWGETHDGVLGAESRGFGVDAELPSGSGREEQGEG